MAALPSRRDIILDETESDRTFAIDCLRGPSLEMQYKKAKHLLRAALNGEPDAWLRIRALHPKPPDSEFVILPHVPRGALDFWRRCDVSFFYTSPRKS
jgi:hypothetical protein